MNLQPDIDLTPYQVGGTEAMPQVRVYWKPRCLRCGWTTEPEQNKSVATMESMLHIKNGECLATTGGEPNGNAV